MKKHLALSILPLAMIVGLTACGKEEEKRRTEALNENVIQDGTYKSTRCYKNKQETTLALGSPRFSQGMLVFSTNGTGTGQYVVYTDPACTVLAGATLEESTKNQTFKLITVTKIDGVSVFRLEQDGTIIDPVWWIPANVSDGGYSFDVDNTDGQSGPYLFEPTPTELAEFKANPGQGVSFDKQ